MASDLGHEDSTWVPQILLDGWLVRLYTQVMAATNTTFTVTHTADQIHACAVLATGTTKADAQAIVARFPKSVGLKASECTGDDFEWVGAVYFTAVLKANDTNGGANETGLKRYAAFTKHAAKLGFTVVGG
jgi:hypothetical protein